MAGTPDEDDPEVSQPAAAPAHAGVPAGALGTSGAGGRLFVADAMAPPIQVGVRHSPLSRRHTVATVSAGITLTMRCWLCPQALGSGAALISSVDAAGPAAHPAPPLRNMGTQGQQRPGAQQVAAYGHVAAGATKATTPPDGASHSLCDRQPEPEHGAVPGEEGSMGPGYRTAPAQGRERMEVATAALLESPAPAGGAAAAAGLGTAEEGGPGPSQPAAGMAGAPYEDDPEVPQPAAAPAHAGLDPGTGQDVIDLTQKGQEIKLEGGLGWAQLIDNIITVLDKHLPDEEKPKIADALNRMEKWRASSEGLVHLQSLAKAYTLARTKCVRFTPKLYAWILLREVEPLLQA
ncbi:hypothetical protein HaLaN_20509 [Haematococcus lacustris]|uniref:Uncharacterized protein n=1 Tax=Haematococcus lacustris TaxID=44745 RepID=A0A699ZW18_HAELA|nr:hypothetical protein HaLaN_20509 [Haematococcus lacustris]